MQGKPRVRCSAVQTFTQIDFPGSIACIAFLPGCNFRCGYCHNPEFVLTERLAETSESWIAEDVFLNFLDQRRGLLDGVVISGGEPTLHAGLSDFMRRIREKGFKVKLDTNGSRPEVLAELLDDHLIDYIAMDVKTSLEKYPELVGPCIRPAAIAESIALIKARAPDYEFRTTLIRECHSTKTIEKIRELIRGAKRYRLQTYRPSVTLDPLFANHHPFTSQEMRTIAESFKPYAQSLLIDAAPHNA
ncbi:anaerobic ribonucleoside-triphosphate reductase activating protein [Candidatus Uhrbacteria bacterium]|nr:anaerobic ribonucleoside-triphosphate reductase activating protein [Candidatus Uhrbacteria bacterium]